MAFWPQPIQQVTNNYYTSDTATSVRGNTTVDGPGTGMVGETLVAELVTANALSLLTTAAKNAVSITLGPGVWLVYGTVGYKANALTVINRVQQGLSDVTDTFGGMGTYTAIPIGATIGSDVVANTPAVEYTVNEGQSKVIYLVAQAFFTISSASTYGKLSARRNR